MDIIQRRSIGTFLLQPRTTVIVSFNISESSSSLDHTKGMTARRKLLDQGENKRQG